MSYTSIVGTGSYYPDSIVTNDDLSKYVETNDQWISERTGIKERRISSGEDTSDLAIKAGMRAIENAGINPDDIGLIIVATITPDSFMPSTACLVQAAIGAKNATAFDITAACTGFVYSIQIADKFLSTSNDMKYALVIGSEVLSKVVDWKDRNTCVIFADGAGAAVLSRDENYGILSSYSGSEGDTKRSLTLPSKSVNNILSDLDEKERIIGMNGRDIFRFATQIIPKSINKVLENTNVNIDEIDYIVPHQANYRIIESVADKMGIDKEKFYMNLDKCGNTSSASIPIALDEMNKKGLLKNDHKIILCGFGGGLTWGSLLINWKNQKNK